MIFITGATIVGFEEFLTCTPHRFNSVRMIPGSRINERDGVINGSVCVTEGFDLPIRSPAIADESSAGFDPSTY
jgi:hypothetical protein